MWEVVVGLRVELMGLTGSLSCKVDTDIGLTDKNVYTDYGAIKTIYSTLALDSLSTEAQGSAKAVTSLLGI